VADGFDAGARIGHLVEADMVAVRPTPAEDYVVIGAPALLRRRGVPVHPSDLRTYPCIVLRRPKATVDHWHFVIDGERIAIDVAGSLVTNDVEAGLRAAVRGAGLFCLPLSLAKSYINAGSLVPALNRFADRVRGPRSLLSESEPIAFEASRIRELLREAHA
jgi:DNA-binding transcriptional LysR family regulator